MVHFAVIRFDGASGACLKTLYKENVLEQLFL